MKRKVMSLNRLNSAVKGFVLTLAPALFMTMLVAGHPVQAAAQSKVQQLLDAQARQRQALNDAMNQIKEVVIQNSSNPDELRSAYERTETPDLIQQELDNQLQSIGEIAERSQREAERNRDRQWTRPDSSSEGGSGCTDSDGSTIPGSENWSACPAN
jgi:septal ring factor EnvC (AmiA/AmiB activator)